MKIFHCDHCGHLLFFENSACVSCQHQVAFLPDLADMGSLDAADDDHWRSPMSAAHGSIYRLCRNYSELQICNWAVVGDDPEPLCVSCRRTRVVPDLSSADARVALYRLESAKRRLIFTLLELGLPLTGAPLDLTFEFKADTPEVPVLTGHASGVITVNIAEADDAERERRRTAMHEPYRTLLGHMRHESGHYYWDRLIADTEHAEAFRARFGDERNDYTAALDNHYRAGPPADWQSRFISAYASALPWEDWAETWAHYLHMVDTLQTAAACGLSLRPKHAAEPTLAKVPAPVATHTPEFDGMLDGWVSVTYVLNNLNRGLGLADGYPFVLSAPAVEKLRFVHDLVVRVRGEGDATSR